jgi:hypothetical protein
MMDLRRSTVDLDFACFNSMVRRNGPPTIAKFQKSKSALSFGRAIKFQPSIARCPFFVGLPVCLYPLHNSPKIYGGAP